MAAKITLIAPLLNESALLPAWLEHLRALPGHWEFVFVDGGSRDQTCALLAQSGLGRVIALDRPGRARQMNAGAAAAGSDILFFLHADTWLPTDAHARVLSALQRPGVSGVCFRLCFDQRHPVLNFIAFFTRINRAYASFGDQGLALRREVFEAIGGFPDIPLAEDIAIQRRLRRRGRVVKLPVCVTTSARRFLRRGILRQILLDFILLAGYYAGISPQWLKRWYSDEGR